MITNGFLRYVVTAEDSGFDEDGLPVEATATLSDPVPCLIQTNSDNRIGSYGGGVFRIASFTILIENSAIEGDRILLERCGEDLGEYAIMEVNPIPIMGRIKIIV